MGCQLLKSIGLLGLLAFLARPVTSGRLQWANFIA